MGGQDRTVEEKIRSIASRAWGVVTRQELLNAAVSARELERRVQKGLLIRVYPAVYRVGHTARSVEATYMAAVKACGPGAVLSGLAAAYLYGILKTKHPPPPEVTTLTERRIPGIKTRRVRGLPEEDVDTWRGIPVTTVARTLTDVASVLQFDDLARTCHEAGVRYRTTPRQVNAVLKRRPNAPGSKKLRRVMRGEARVALSKLERRFLELLREAGLPLPVTNRLAGSKRVDCRWPEHRLTVELDSYTYHASRHAWEQDRRREREAYRRGDRHRRYTYDDVFGDPSEMLAELRELLAA
jgi:very-short-patch-repair endonuclease